MSRRVLVLAGIAVLTTSLAFAAKAPKSIPWEDHGCLGACGWQRSSPQQPQQSAPRPRG